MSNNKLRPVYELDIDNNIVREYEDIKDVAKERGGNITNLLKVLNYSHRTFKGYSYVDKDLWDKYVDSDDEEKYVRFDPNECPVCLGRGRYNKIIDKVVITLECEHKIPKVVAETFYTKFKSESVAAEFRLKPYAKALEDCK